MKKTVKKEWEPAKHLKHLYVKIYYPSGRGYWHRKDKLENLPIPEKKENIPRGPLPDSPDTKVKKEREIMAKFLKTGKW